MITAYFDVIQFVAAIDQVRAARGKKPHDLFRETGIYYASWTQYQRGSRAMSVHTMATLAVWAELDVNSFIKQEGVKA